MFIERRLEAASWAGANPGLNIFRVLFDASASSLALGPSQMHFLILNNNRPPRCRRTSASWLALMNKRVACVAAGYLPPSDTLSDLPLAIAIYRSGITWERTKITSELPGVETFGLRGEDTSTCQLFVLGVHSPDAFFHLVNW